MHGINFITTCLLCNAVITKSLFKFRAHLFACLALALSLAHSYNVKHTESARHWKY